MQTLHAEYSESCALFNAEKSLEGFQAYVAMVKGGVGGKQGGVKEEGGSPLDFLDKGRDHSDIEDEEEEGGAAEAGKKKKKMHPPPSRPNSSGHATTNLVRSRPIVT